MIKYKTYDKQTEQEFGVSVALELTANQVIQLHSLLQRALNTLPPHHLEWSEWYELSDRLEHRIAN